MPALSSPHAFLAAWERTLARRGEAPAVLAVDGSTQRTFAEIAREAGEWAGRLAHLPPHTVVAVQLGNEARWPALMLALSARQLIPLPLGRHLEKEDLRSALELAGAAALFTEEGLQERAGGRPLPGTEFLKLTSGTTGTPRAVRFLARQLVADGENICATMGLGPEDLNYGVIPLSHSYGFSNLLMPLLIHGVPMVLSDDRFPRAILAGLRATGATVFPGMPVLFDKLAALEPAALLPRLRLCLSAGAPLPPGVGTAFSQRFGLKVHTFYGSSECGGIAYDRGEERAYAAGFLGTAMEGVRLQPSPDGRLAVRSAAVGEGYLPEDAAGDLRAGCFVPGDLIRWEGERLWLEGRASEIINIAGRKLHPGEVEAPLEGLPGVQAVVCFGVPSALRGEEPILCVAGAGLDRGALQRHCAERLSAWQQPRDIWLVAELPVSDRGKISRRALAEAYLARTGA